MGDLERAVMDHLWAAGDARTVREVHEEIGAGLAYTTVMTVMQRLAAKGLLHQERDRRAHRFRPSRPREDLLAELMAEALGQAEDADETRAALVGFVQRADPDQVAALRAALARVDDAEAATPRRRRRPARP